MWQPEDYVLFRKCGELTISPDVHCLGFNCAFCASTCLKADIFLHHLQDQHKEDVFKMYHIKNTGADGGLFQINQIQIVNRATLDVQWSDGDPHQIACMTIGVQGHTDPIEVSPEMITLTSGQDTLNATEDTALDVTNDLWANTQIESLLDTNPADCNDTPMDSLSIVPFSPTTTTTPCSATPVNDCEIGDGEDSGIVVAQIPCLNACKARGTEAGGLCDGVCSGFSACLSLNGDSSSKSEDTSADSWKTDTIQEEEVMYPFMSTDENHYTEQQNGKYLKTAAMRKALERKEVISCLLELYRANEKLWNPEHPSYKYNARRTVYTELSKPLLQKINVTLSGVEIFSILNILRGRYRRELSKFHARKGKHRSRLWYFDEMNFLRRVIEGKRKMRLSDRNGSAEPGDLTNRQVLSFIIEQYKNCECLWNPKDGEYGACNKSALFGKIAVRLKEELNVFMGQKETENEMQKLRIRYRKELRVMHKLKGLYIPKLWCFDELDFLRPVMEEKIIKNVKENSRRLLPLPQGKHSFHSVEEIKFPGFEQQMIFIDTYRKYASLWDVDHPDYRSTFYRNIAMQAMLKELNMTLQPLNVSLEQLEKTLHQLRKDFSVEKSRRLRDKSHLDKNGTASSVTMSLLVYEKLSAFLASNLGPFQCEDCHHMCKTYDQYKIHKSKHDGALPFICTLCGKGFQMPGNLTIHIRRHRQDFPYSCETCNKSFATSTEVTIHMRSHTGERPE